MDDKPSWDSPIEEWPGIQRKELSNGFKVVLFHNSFPPHRVEVQLQVHTGSISEREDQQGLAHYLEHCVFLGTEKYDAKDLIPLLASWGLSFGGDANAFTAFRVSNASVKQFKL